MLNHRNADGRTASAIEAAEIEEVDVNAGFIIGSTCCSLDLEEDDVEFDSNEDGSGTEEEASSVDVVPALTAEDLRQDLCRTQE